VPISAAASSATAAPRFSRARFSMISLYLPVIRLRRKPTLTA
jgi:hypothetical protein